MFRWFDSAPPPATRLISLASQKPPPLDAFSLCELAGEVLNIEIHRTPEPGLPVKLPALVHRLDDGWFEILYRPKGRALSIQIFLLHELSHLLLGHCQRKSVEWFLPTVYTDAEERRAERLAYQMMDFIIQYNQHPILTRFVRLISREPETVHQKKKRPPTCGGTKDVELSPLHRNRASRSTIGTSPNASDMPWNGSIC